MPDEGAHYVANFDYEASFEKAQDARLRISFVQRARGWEIDTFSFGVPQSQPGARELVADLMRALQPQ